MTLAALLLPCVTSVLSCSQLLWRGSTGAAQAESAVPEPQRLPAAQLPPVQAGGSV